MRLKHPDGTIVHLSSGTNVLPAEEVDGLVAQVGGIGGGVRDALGAARIGLGLWLPAEAAFALAADPVGVDRLRQQLDRHGIEVVTLNAFPYAGFHDPVVKKKVYSPDWSQRLRLDYTVACATVLSRLLPDDVERGSISSLPLGWRTPWLADRQSAAMAHLGELATSLEKLRADTGRHIRVALEPEPGCVVETSADVVERLAGVNPEWVGVCLDLCHLAVGFEPAEDARANIAKAGLSVVKVQAAAALHVQDPGDAETREALEGFSEDRFLHQVRQRAGARVLGRDDLDQAITGDRPMRTGSPWRVHFHVPVNTDPAPPLRNTSQDLIASLTDLFGGATAHADHVEVETYTWDVLPPGMRPTDEAGLVRGLAGELAWVRDELIEIGLEVA